MSEEWKPVPGCPAYEASSLGRIRKHYKSITKTVGHRRQNDYWAVCVHGRTILRHVLVARAFHGEPLPGQLVRHLNGIPGDDRPDNLAWGSPVENAQDSIRHGTNYALNKTHCKWGHEFTEINTFIDNLGRRICRTCKGTHDQALTRKQSLKRAQRRWAERQQDPRRTLFGVLRDGSHVVCYRNPRPRYYREWPPQTLRTRVQISSPEFSALVRGKAAA